MKPGALYTALTRPPVRVMDPHGRALAKKVFHNAGILADPQGWTGGDAFLRRIRTAVSPFALEIELRDAELFGAWLSRKTREKAAKAARVRLAELRGEVLGEGEV